MQPMEFRYGDRLRETYRPVAYNQYERFAYGAVIKNLAKQMLIARGLLPDHWTALDRLEKRFDRMCKEHENLKISRMEYVGYEPIRWQGTWRPDPTPYEPWKTNPSYWLGPKDLGKPNPETWRFGGGGIVQISD